MWPFQPKRRKSLVESGLILSPLQAAETTGLPNERLVHVYKYLKETWSPREKREGRWLRFHPHEYKYYPPYVDLSGWSEVQVEVLAQMYRDAGYEVSHTSIPATAHTSIPATVGEGWAVLFRLPEWLRDLESETT